MENRSMNLNLFRKIDIVCETLEGYDDEARNTIASQAKSIFNVNPFEVEDKEMDFCAWNLVAYTGDILGYAGPIITLKPVFAEAAHLTPEVQGCSAPEAAIKSWKKKKAVSVNPVYFSKHSS